MKDKLIVKLPVEASAQAWQIITLSPTQAVAFTEPQKALQATK